jgi:hypothetical protein
MSRPAKSSCRAGTKPDSCPDGEDRPLGASGAAGRLVHASVDGEDAGQPGEGKDPKHLVPRRGQQQVAPGMPSLLAPAYQRRQSAGIDETQACQVNDDPGLAGSSRRKRSRDACRCCHVELPAQDDDNVTVTVAGTQIHAAHRDRLFCFSSKAGS